MYTHIIIQFETPSLPPFIRYLRWGGLQFWLDPFLSDSALRALDFNMKQKIWHCHQKLFTATMALYDFCAVQLLIDAQCLPYNIFFHANSSLNTFKREIYFC